MNAVTLAMIYNTVLVICCTTIIMFGLFKTGNPSWLGAILMLLFVARGKVD